MSEWDDSMQEILKNFLKSKKSDVTRAYIEEICKYLKTEFDNEKSGLVRSKDLQNYILPNIIPNVGTYYRLLNGLVDAGIVHKQIGESSFDDSVKKPVYYRLPRGFYKWPSYQEIAKKKDRYQASFFIIAGKLSAAYELLEENGIPNPDDDVNKRYEEITTWNDLTPWAYSDKQIKDHPLIEFGISRIYPNITFIPPFRHPYRPNERPPYGDDY